MSQAIATAASSDYDFLKVMAQSGDAGAEEHRLQKRQRKRAASTLTGTATTLSSATIIR